MKATPEYKEEFLEKLDGRLIEAPVDGQGGFDKLLDVLSKIGFFVDYAQLHHDSTGKPNNLLHIGIDENICSLSEDAKFIFYSNQFIFAKEVLSWFKENEELQVFEDKGQKFTIEGHIKDKCLEDLKESESFNKIDAELIDWSKKNPKVIKKERDKGFEDILKKTLEKRENKMTYAELKRKRRQEISEEDRAIDTEFHFNEDFCIYFLQNPYSLESEPLIYYENAKLLTKEEYFKFRVWADKMFSTVESEE